MDRPGREGMIDQVAKRCRGIGGANVSSIDYPVICDVDARIVSMSFGETRIMLEFLGFPAKFFDRVLSKH